MRKVPFTPADSVFDETVFSTFTRPSYESSMRYATLTELASNVSFVTTLRCLQVECPHKTCTAKRGDWCNHPSGRQTGIHIARWRKAYAEGYWSESATLTLWLEERDA